MLITFGCLLLCVLFVLSFYGWGSLLSLRLNESMRVAPTVAVGMALFISLGGVLNTSGLAYGFISLAILGVGALFGATKCLRQLNIAGLPRLQTQPLWTAILVASLMLVLIVYLFTFVAFPSVLNTYDDFQKYLLHPIKMLETGSLFGSPVATVGKEVLGGQGFLQSPFIYLFGLKAVNVLDAVLCLLLLCFAVLEHALKAKQLAVGVVLTVFIVLFNTQYVNVSALYSATFLMACSLLIVWRIGTEASLSDIPMLSAYLGIIFASMVSLKISFALFGFILFCAWSTALYLRSYGFKQSLHALLIAASLAILALVPWMQTLWENFSFIESHPSYDRGLMFGLQGWPLMFETAKNYYGVVPLLFSAIVFLALVFSAVLVINKEFRGAPIVMSAMISTLAIYVLVMCVMGPRFLGSTTALRYAAPFILGTIPIMVLAGIGLSAAPVFRMLVIALVLVLSGFLLPSTLNSFEQQARCGHRLPFPDELFCNKKMASYNERVLNGNYQTRVRGWQKHIPEGEPFWAWVATPFLFDFERNKIYEVDSNGLSNPWRHIPEDAKYFVIQRSGVGFSSFEEWNKFASQGNLFDAGIAANVLIFFSKVAEMPKRLIYQSDEVMIFQQM